MPLLSLPRRGLPLLRVHLHLALLRLLQLEEKGDQAPAAFHCTCQKAFLHQLCQAVDLPSLQLLR